MIQTYSKIAGVSVVSIGIISGLVSLLPEDPMLKAYGLYSLIITIGITIGWHAFTIIRRFIRRSGSFYADYIHNLKQHDESWCFGNKWYTKWNLVYPSKETTLAWWSNYRKGAIVIRDKYHREQGYFSIWPVQPSVFERLVQGQLTESEITSSELQCNILKGHDYWYIADILRAMPKKQYKGLVGNYLRLKLIYEAFRHVLDSGDFAEEFEVVAFAETTAGEAILKEYKFTHFKPKQPSRVSSKIYRRVFRKSEVKALFLEIRKGLKSREPDIHHTICLAKDKLWEA